jgi:uncharacterized protein with von Willebrand factor type A (vWA) domain
VSESTERQDQLSASELAGEAGSQATASLRPAQSAIVPTSDWSAGQPETGDPSETVGGLGDGSGGGGSGDGFFGVHPQGGRVVFVVDSSKSMNFPHPSPAKTRFGKLKWELVSAITRMEADTQFYVIFFNEIPIPMPGADLQPAKGAAQKGYLKWVAAARTGGLETDPRDALLMALRLRPDEIYFLTDGEFAWKIQRDLRELHQTATAVHTIAFGNQNAEKLLKSIATANGGTYHFVP